MVKFSEIIGHEDIIRHLQSAIENRKISHSYILTGEAGSGKKMVAYAFAAALQCEKKGIEPCMECDSCKKAKGRNHPDIITVNHEKSGIITVEEIREQLVSSAQTPPYESEYKIFIVPEAGYMNPQAQNALLKTIEDTPPQVVILLLTTNIELLLPTIRSRCVHLDLKVVDDRQIKDYLIDHLHVSSEDAEIETSFAHGSVGRAKKAADSEEFKKMVDSSIRILSNVDNMEVYELTEAISSISGDKQILQDYLDIFQFWFRDVLLFKATREIDNLVFKHELNEISREAKARSYENLEEILDALEKTKVRLQANVNVELALELLFLTIREK